MFYGKTTFKDHMIFLDQGIRFGENNTPYFNLMVITPGTTAEPGIDSPTGYSVNTTAVMPGQPVYFRLYSNSTFDAHTTGSLQNPALEVQFVGDGVWSGDSEVGDGFSDSRKRRFSSKLFDDLNATSAVGIQVVAPTQREGESDQETVGNYRLILGGLGVMVIEATDPIDLVMYMFKNYQWVKICLVEDESDPNGYAIDLYWQDPKYARA